MDKASSPHNPESGPQLSQGGLDPTVPDSFVSLADEQDGERVVVVEENRVNRREWKIGILELSTTPPQLIIMLEKTELSPQLWKVLAGV